MIKSFNHIKTHVLKFFDLIKLPSSDREQFEKSCRLLLRKDEGQKILHYLYQTIENRAITGETKAEDLYFTAGMRHIVKTLIQATYKNN